MLENDVKFSRSEKRVLLLLALFLIMILASQVLQFLNNRNNENEYRKILASRMATVESIQKTTTELTSVHRALLNLLISSSPAEVEKFNDIKSSAFLALEREMVAIANNIFSAPQSDKAGKIESEIREYKNATNDFLVILEKDKARAVEFKNTRIRPAFEAFQKAQSEFIATLNADLQAESDKLTQASITASLLILLLGISPFILFLLYFIVQSSRILYHELF